jgi:hypothetical protein
MLPQRPTGSAERYVLLTLTITIARHHLAALPVHGFIARLYRSCLDPRIELRMRIREIAQARVRYGYRKIRVLLNREGWHAGKYLVYRLCKEEGLMLKRMKPAGKRKAAGLREEKVKLTRQRVYQSCHGPVGLSERGKDRLLTAWQAD